MHFHIAANNNTVSGGVFADDFLRYSITSTASRIEKKYIGNMMAEADAAKHQLLAPNCFIIFAVKKPLNHEVSALRINAIRKRAGRKKTLDVANITVRRKVYNRMKI